MFLQWGRVIQLQLHKTLNPRSQVSEINAIHNHHDATWTWMKGVDL